MSEDQRPSREDRQSRIADYVLHDGTASAASLASTFDVSLMTMYRDLDELERQGLVRKFRGGVTAHPSTVFESNIAYRRKTLSQEKLAIAQVARSFIEPGMGVMLDDSTTTLQLVDSLHDVTPLTVITNFVEVISSISRIPGIRLIALGGEYYPSHDSFLGVPCIEAIESLRADILFTSTSAASTTHAFHQEQEIVLVKRAMMRAATRRVLLIDHTKLGRTALHQLAPLSDFDDIVVDSGVSSDVLENLRDQHLNVHVSDPWTSQKE